MGRLTPRRNRKGFWWVLAAVGISILWAPAPGAAQTFVQVNEDGFGEPGNDYVWSMTLFDNGTKECLYVGTSRYVSEQIMGFIGMETELGSPGEWEWANALRAQIWRLCLSEADESGWEKVYQSGVSETEEGFFPNQSGFRKMIVHENKLYALSGAGWVESRLLVRSQSGDVDDWEEMVTAADMGNNGRAMEVHKGSLYLGGAFGSPRGGSKSSAVLWRLTSEDTWEEVADFTDWGAAPNVGIGSLRSFNGSLYVGTENMETGYQVWRTDEPEAKESGWTKLVDYGGGDMYNLSAATMEVFEDRLYVASQFLPIGAADGRMEMRMPLKGFELIRIDKSDRCELIVGDVHPYGWEAPMDRIRFPKSRYTGGFSNRLNSYGWSMLAFGDVLFLGTFDNSNMLASLLPSDFAEATSLIRGERKLGADLWVSRTGVDWEPVFIDGLGDEGNYGLRNLVGVDGTLFMGTANAYTGGEVWAFDPGVLLAPR